MRIKIYNIVPGSIKNCINLNSLKIIKAVIIESFFVLLTVVYSFE